MQRCKFSSCSTCTLPLDLTYLQIDKEKELESWGTIADGAEYIYGECTVGADINRLVAGQTFYKDKWNVILTKEWC